MKKGKVLGLVAGISAGVAALLAGGFATKKVVKEIQKDLSDFTFASDDGRNVVTLSYGASNYAKGLTYVQVKAMVDNSDLNCKMVMFAIKNTEVFNGEWSDNEHFKLTIGSGKRCQCCDVDFSGDEINMFYYIDKGTEEDVIIECEVADDETIEALTEETEE